MADNPIVLIDRDSFARQDIVRQACDYALNYACKWCGAHRVKQGGGTVGGGIGCKHMYRYGTQRSDSLSGTVDWHRGEFCSKDCHDSYHHN